MSVFFFGMGYSSRASACAIHSQIDSDMSIYGTSRSTEMTDILNQENVQAHVFDGTGPAPFVSDALMKAQYVVNSIAPDADGDPVLTHHATDLDRAKKLEWLCYYSTVGVYGNFDGHWIDEHATCQPLNTRSKWRVRVEDEWRRYADKRDVPLLILRLAGIYGPGRSTFDKLKAGTAKRIIKHHQVFNRIHVADIGRVTALAMQAKLAGTFNLADDEPAPPQDLVVQAAKMANVTPPEPVTFEDADMTPMARSFYSDNKRVSNGAIKRALDIDLLYPTYRDGLKAIHQNGSF